jgi:uncharacterized Zn finger protein
MRETAAAKASRYLLEGRVVVDTAGPAQFAATVHGSSGQHLVTYVRGGWSCTCPCLGRCSHLLAAYLIAAASPTRRTAA